MDQVIWLSMLGMATGVVFQRILIAFLLPLLKRRSKIKEDHINALLIILSVVSATIILYLFLRPLPTWTIKPTALSPLDYVLVFFAQFLTLVINIICISIRSFLRKEKLSENESFSYFSTPSKCFLTLIFMPVLEEFISRKIPGDRAILQGGLFFIFLSALIFAMMHILSREYFLVFSTFYIGLLYAWIYLHSGSVWIVILYHISHNFFLVYLLQTMKNKKIMNLYFYFLILSGIVSSILLYPRFKQSFSGKELSQTGNILKTIFTHPGTLIYLIASILAVIHIRYTRKDKEKVKNTSP